jgi:hypothetical protein
MKLWPRHNSYQQRGRKEQLELVDVRHVRWFQGNCTRASLEVIVPGLNCVIRDRVEPTRRELVARAALACYSQGR